MTARPPVPSRSGMQGAVAASLLEFLSWLQLDPWPGRGPLGIEKKTGQKSGVAEAHFVEAAEKEIHGFPVELTPADRPRRGTYWAEKTAESGADGDFDSIHE